MAFGASTIWEVQSGGSDSLNAGGFDPGSANFATDASYTAANTASPVVTSASYTFLARDVGHWFFDKLGTNQIPGWYKIVSVSAGAATLDAAIGHAVLYEGGIASRLNTAAGCATVASPTGGTWGIDYSQSTSPGISYSDMVIDGTLNTKFSSALNPIRPNIVGNAISITGGTGFTVQRAQVLSTAGTVSATCDKSLGTLSSTGGIGGLGGALASPGMAAGLFVAQNSMYVQSGTYLMSATQNVSGGKVLLATQGAANANQFMIGYGAIRCDFGTKPILKSNANSMRIVEFSGGYSRCINFSFQKSAGNTTIRGFYQDNGPNTTVDRCKFDSLDAGGALMDFNGQQLIINCEAVACGVGANTALNVGGCTGSLIAGCYVHGGGGISIVSNNKAINCIVDGNPAAGIIGDQSSVAVNCLSINNTGGGGNGFASIKMLINCIGYGNAQPDFTNSTGAQANYTLLGCAGRAVGTGYLLAEYPSWAVIGYQTLTADPFTNSAGGDYTPNATAGGGAMLQGLGWPVTLPALIPTNYPTIGVYQPQPSTGGGGGGGATGAVNRWSPMDLQGMRSMGHESSMYIGPTPGNLHRGIALPKNRNAGYQDVVKIPPSVTLATGIKLDFALVDDGSSTVDLGKAVVLGVIVKKLTSGTDNLDISSSAGAEVAQAVTLAATSGVVTLATVSVPNANLDGAAAGDTIEVLIRRVGDSPSDTCFGRVLCASITAYGY